LVSISQQSISNAATVPTIKTPHKATALKSNPNQPDSTNLKNFFQNLLNKNAPAAPVANSTLSNESTTPRGSTSDQPGKFFTVLIRFFIDSSYAFFNI
jgi:hypothetical protein